MRLKNKLYKKEQEDIADKIIEILELNDEKSITLYDIDNNEDKKQKILDLIPSIRIYFNFKNITGAINPNKVKRPYMSIIRHITRLKYKIKSQGIRIKRNNCNLWTQQYIFTKH